MAGDGIAPKKKVLKKTVRLNASGEVLAAIAGKRIYVVSWMLNVEADDISVTISETDTPTATNTIYRGKHSKHGGAGEFYGVDSAIPSEKVNQNIYATLNSGAGYFTINIKYFKD